MSIAKKIKPVQTSDLIIAALFYGKAGTGKTTLAASFPKPALLVDIREKGTDSVSDVKGLDVLKLENWDEFEEVYWHLVKSDKYKTVILDGVSQLQDMALDAAREEERKPEGFLSQRIWGLASAKMKTWIINFRDLVDNGLNVVFLTHDRTSSESDSDDNELTPFVGPALMPSVAATLTASVKVVANTFIQETKKMSSSGIPKSAVQYAVRIGPHAQYETKIRQPKGSYLPRTVPNFDYDKLVALMRGEYKDSLKTKRKSEKGDKMRSGVKELPPF